MRLLKQHDPDFSVDHSRRIPRAAYDISLFLRQCGWDISSRQLRIFSNAALLHDIGKIGIPYELLHKKELLTADDWARIQQHPALGAFFADMLGLPEEAAIIRAHQEKIDGTGYPDHLVGDAIPLGARIIAIADAIDAMGNDRPYGETRTRSWIVRELWKCRGTQFDAPIVEALLSSAPFLHRIFDSFRLPDDPLLPRKGSLIPLLERAGA